MLSGLMPSWLLLSSHVFVPLTEVVAVSCVFVIVYPSAAVPVTAAYSLWMYSLQLTCIHDIAPAIFFARFVHVYIQLFSALSTTAFPDALPSA
jgi:hypothetical protein